ncbi:MAG TPA: RDD family protein [Thermoanaerobaculia bacterium]|nr:RDD family protein [Thermoanaerobaculia bacterium]
MRFDEVELEAVPLGGIEPEVVAVAAERDAAPRFKRLLALLADLSLFVALALALSPLLPQPATWLHFGSLAGFVVVMSYYYFVGSWLLWGKTIGGTIFDVRVAANEGAMSLRAATLRWLGLYLGLATSGLGLLFLLPDKLSSTHCVRA